MGWAGNREVSFVAITCLGRSDFQLAQYNSSRGFFFFFFTRLIRIVSLCWWICSTSCSGSFCLRWKNFLLCELLVFIQNLREKLQWGITENINVFTSFQRVVLYFKYFKQLSLPRKVGKEEGVILPTLKSNTNNNHMTPVYLIL